MLVFFMTPFKKFHMIAPLHKGNVTELCKSSKVNIFFQT